MYSVVCIFLKPSVYSVYIRARASTYDMGILITCKHVSNFIRKAWIIRARALHVI